MFKVPINKRASNIGPYLNFIKFLIPNVFSVCKFGPCRLKVRKTTRRGGWIVFLETSSFTF